MPARVLGVGIRATAANIWTAIQTFGSGLLKLRNPAGTFAYIFKGAAIVADRDVTMPLLTGADTLVTEGMAQTLSNKTFVAPALGTPASGVMTNVTGLPAAAVLAGSLGAGAYVVSTSLQAATIELGHATDTTLSRVSAGVVAVEGVTLVDLSSVQTLTTKTLTSPVVNTQLTGTAVGTGASQVAAGDHTHAASGAVTRAGGNTTEATTTSTTQVSLLSVASLSIGAGVPVSFVTAIRKSSGAADTASVGVRVNATDVVAPSVTNAFNATNEAQDGVQVAEFYANTTSYVAAGEIRHWSSASAGGGNKLVNNSLNVARSATIPAATITDLITTGLVANASTTLGADESQVYTYAIS